MLLNAIKSLPTPLWGRTAYLKLPKSDDVGCAIAGLPTEGILTEKQALWERRALHPRPEGRGFSRNSGNRIFTRGDSHVSGSTCPSLRAVEWRHGLDRTGRPEAGNLHRAGG